MTDTLGSAKSAANGATKNPLTDLATARPPTG